MLQKIHIKGYRALKDLELDLPSRTNEGYRSNGSMQNWSMIVQETVFQAHWTRAMENSLDAPHLPFIHRWTIGMGVRASAERGARMDTTFNPTEYGGRIHWSIDGATSGGQVGSLEAGHELSVRSDRATLAFRKYYDENLRHSGIDVSTSPRRALDLVA